MKTCLVTGATGFLGSHLTPKLNELGFKVYYFFVFTDKTLYLELDPEDCEFNMKLTGTHNIPHYLIPISKLTELKEEEISLED